MDGWLQGWMNQWKEGRKGRKESMYLCTNVPCTHVCKYTSMYVGMHAGMHVSLKSCIHVSPYEYVHVWMYECMYVWMYVCMYVCMYHTFACMVLSLHPATWGCFGEVRSHPVWMARLWSNLHSNYYRLWQRRIYATNPGIHTWRIFGVKRCKRDNATTGPQDTYMAPIEDPRTHDTLHKSSNPHAPAFGSKNPFFAAAIWAKIRNKANLIPKPSKCPNSPSNWLRRCILQGVYISFFDLIHPVPPKKKEVAWISRGIQDHLGATFKRWWNLKH